MTKANMPVIVRDLSASDVDAWWHLWTAYLAFYKSTLPDAVKEATFRRLVDPTYAEMSGMVAESGGTLMGLVHTIRHAHCWRTEDVVYLQDLYVTPESRGTGCGRMLIEAVYAAADAAGTPSVYWMTEHHNATGRQLYDRIGDLTTFIKYQRPAP